MRILPLLVLLSCSAAWAQQPFTCNATSSGVPLVRARGQAELITDILVFCSGTRPTTGINTTVQVTLNTPLTSRIVNPGINASEALLLINEPAPAGQLTQPAGTIVPGANVVQGVQAGLNGVTFFNVPIVEPGAAVPVQVTLRIVNIRANVSSLSEQANVSVIVSIVGPVPVSILGSLQTAAIVAHPFVFSVRNAEDSAAFSGIFDGCSGNKPIVNSFTPADMLLKFSESFAAEFRERNIATSVENPGAIADQNIPGNFYGTESGFLNTLFPPTNGLNQAGLATQGTRLMARFNGIPAGAGLWVMAQPALLGSSTTGITARLIQTDANGTGAFAPIPPAIGPWAPVPVSGGSAIAVWEALDPSSIAMESLSFGVVVSIPPNTSTGGTFTVTGLIAPLSTSPVVSFGTPAPNFAPIAPPVAVTETRPCQPLLSITTACPLPPATARFPYSASFAAVGGLPPHTWSVFTGTLPPGLTLSPAGLLSGTPIQAGIFPFGVRVVDLTGVAVTKDCSLEVLPGVNVVTACPLPDAVLSVPYAHVLVASGGTPPFSWLLRSGSLPPGLTLSPGGVLTGNPTAAGTFPFTLQVTDSRGVPGLKECSLRVSAPFVLAPAVLDFAVSTGGTAPLPQIIHLSSETPGQTYNLRLSTDSGGDWLRATPVSGRIPAQIEVAVLPGTLPPGAYRGLVIVTTSGQIQQSSTVAVNLTVGQPIPARLVAEPSAVAVAVPRGTARASRSIGVVNRGSGSIAFSASVEFLSGQGWLGVSPAAGSAAAGAPGRLRLAFSLAQLSPGTYRARIRLESTATGETLVVPVTLSISPGSEAMLVSQAALAFTAVANAAPPPTQTFHVLSAGTAGFFWAASTNTDPGLPVWLGLSPANGAAVPGNPSPVEVRVNQAGLIPGRYYGEIQVNAGVDNAPRLVFVSLTVLEASARPGPLLEPSGLLFTGTAGGANPPSQSVFVRNLGSAAFRFDVYLAGDERIWSLALPPDRTVAPGAAARLEVQVNPAGLAGGIHRATLFVQSTADTQVRTADIGLILAGGRTAAVQRTAEAVCPPGGLHLVTLTQAAGFTSATGLPLPLEVRVADATGSPLAAGSVTASFRSSATSALALVHVTGGRWAGTLQPPQSGGPAVISILAEDPDRSLTGCLDLTGTVADTGAPVIADGGLLSAASFAPGSPLSPGGMAAIFGSKLAEGRSSAQALPLPPQLGATRVSIGGRLMPLFFAGDLGAFSQVNGVLPYGLAPHVSHQISLRRGAQFSFADVIVADAQPGLFTVTQTGEGQGVIVHGSNPLLVADAANPVARGDVIVIYCEGLGLVDPGLIAGQLVPSSPLSRAALPVRVRIDGQEAEVLFAGLTPGLTGLYQINTVVPEGVTPGGSVSVVVSVSGQTGPPVTIAVRP